MLTLYFNGECVELAGECSLADLLEARTLPGQPYAVAVNDVFVPRGRYARTCVKEGDRVELVVAGQGG